MGAVTIIELSNAGVIVRVFRRTNYVIVQQLLLYFVNVMYVMTNTDFD